MADRGVEGSRRMPDLVALDGTRAKIAQEPEHGAGALRSVTEWNTGTNALSTMRGHAIATDEPQDLGGEDAAPDPMELLLAAVGSCLTIGWVKHARARDVEVRSIRVDVDAPFDLRGYFDLDSDVRQGFGQLTYTVFVDCDADEATLAEIASAAERTSPLVDNVLHATPVSGSVVRHPTPD